MHSLVDESGKKIAVYQEIKRYGVDAKYEPPDRPQTAGEELDARVKQMRLNHPKLSYVNAMHLILDADRTLKIRFAREG
jgi:hypothetical protein